MRVPLYQIDAFTKERFSGNPAAVCPLEEWLPDEVMQQIAAENCLPETAFFVGSDGRYELLILQGERLSSVEVVTEPEVRIMTPREIDIDLFSLGIKYMDSLPDGRLLIIRSPDTELGASELRLVLNWTQELTRLVPVP